MSLVVINGRYIFEKKNCENLMWTDAGELYAHAIQVKKKTQHSMGCGSTWGKVNACILHLCNRKVFK